MKKEILQPKMESDDPWIHRSKKMRCIACMYFCIKKNLDGQSSIGRCRRHAPTMNGFPVVFPTDWCGDHKLDENKI
jgi:Pyruvate/2-oxoacid:ferredoxin oxidoreductase delta subunit